ncbi:MAG: hypothetical protein M3R04_07980 [bacterium]|nr:hypothetical protein [bacterium]
MESKEEPVVLTAGNLDEGLGIGLAMLGDYKAILDATKGWGIEWELTATGGTTLRMASAGMIVYAKDGVISGWSMDVPVVFAEKGWSPWLRTLREAGIDPTLSTTDTKGAAIGESTQYLHSAKSEQTRDGWVSPVYELRYANGTLRQIKGGVEFGTGHVEAPDKVDVATPPTAYPGG